jgi:hypothetical protein
MLNKSLAFVGLLALSQISAADGRIYNARITSIEMRSTGQFILTLDQSAGGAPACGAAHPNMMAGDLGWVGGRALFDTATVAFKAGTPFYLEGNGICNALSGYESIYRMTVGGE